MLVVAGHDPTGGAGVDADREALAAFGCQAVLVVTARTDQDGRRVRALGARDPGAWLAEARAELAHPAGLPAALKTGLLPGAAHVHALARLLDELPGDLPRIVDPLLAASGGEEFLDAAGRAALVAEILRRGVGLTPNLPEAARLLGLELESLRRSRAARLAAAERLIDAGAGLVVLKGGHDDLDPAADLVLERGRSAVWLEHPRVPGKRLHGSGCRFAAALAAGLARGELAPASARAAGEWVARLIGERGEPLGADRPPR